MEDEFLSPFKVKNVWVIMYVYTMFYIHITPLMCSQYTLQKYIFKAKGHMPEVSTKSQNKGNN